MKKAGSLTLCLGNLFLRRFLSFLDYSMCGNDQCIGLCVPECEQSVLDFVVECSELPYLSTFQLREDDGVSLAFRFDTSSHIDVSILYFQIAVQYIYKIV